jgi:CDP-2,3-bis-(O-geranylgeranyl)-sn-glycerol synthase
MFDLAVLALWYILPAYVANASATLSRGRTPIDLGIKFFDGRRLLGKGKTIKGFFIGVFFGGLVGVIQGLADAQFGAITLEQRVVLALVLAVGAMAGDALGSFVKRRFDVPSGAAAPFLDQWDFVLGAFALAWLASPFIAIPFPNFTTLLLVLVMTAFLHVLSNYAAYCLKLKKVPW